VAGIRGGGGRHGDGLRLRRQAQGEEVKREGVRQLAALEDERDWFVGLEARQVGCGGEVVEKRR
jgi:hypothetical protein